MNKSICYIVGAGEDYGLDFTPSLGDFVIAADGGFDHLHKHNITADLIIGDFDSVSAKPVGDSIIELAAQKDYTDTYEAIQRGIALGYEVFHLYCCTGGRFDHTLANIQVLAYLSESGKRGCLVGRDYVVAAVTNSSISFDAGCGGTVSVFSHTSKSEGVNIRRMKYEVLDCCFTNTNPIGVSNEFTGKACTVSVRSGTLLVVFPREYIGAVIYE